MGRPGRAGHWTRQDRASNAWFRSAIRQCPLGRLWSAAWSTKVLVPPLREGLDKGLGATLINYCALAEIPEKRDKLRVFAAAIVSKDLEHVARVGQPATLCIAQKQARDPVEEGAAEDEEMIVFEFV